MVDLHERRMSILRRVESGELSLEDGNNLLLELEERSQDSAEAPASPVSEKEGLTSYGSAGQSPALPAVGADPSSTAQPAAAVGPQQPVVEHGQVVEGESSRSPDGWKALWILPFLLGLFLTLVSINWMYLGWAAAGLGWGFWLSFFPLALGIVLMWVGWELRAARWLHVRIRQAPGDHPAVISFSLPLPIGLTRWAVQRFGKYSPQVNGHDISEFIDEFDLAIATDGPMHVYVDQEDGQQVEIWVEGPKKS